MPSPDFQVVILAGGECKRLYPLTSAGPVKALLPVGNRPLISYPLRNLAEAGIKSCIVVAIGEAVSSSMSSYLAAQEAAGGVSCNVITVPEECGTADALRLVAGQVSAETLVVASGDILTDLPLRALVVTHQITGALATVLLGKRKTSPTAETKPGKAPKGVDYLGLDPSRQLLLFAASSPDVLRDIKLPLAAAQQLGAVQLHSDLQDQHLYVMSRSALKLLVSKPALSSLKLDFIPWLTRHQLKHAQPAAAAAAGFAGRASAGGAAAGGTTGSSFLLLHRQPSGGSFGSLTSASSLTAGNMMPAAQAADGDGDSGAAAGSNAGNTSNSAGAAGRDAAAGHSSRSGGAAASADGDAEGGAGGSGQPAMPGDGFMALSHSGSAAASSRAGRVGVYLVPEGHYCARVNTLQAYGDVNREVSRPGWLPQWVAAAPDPAQARHAQQAAPWKVPTCN
ncbi:nucleotide-diphospho-sugar transferase [Scenedesmus sp. NREL 46B-D3]|nr:nucleotide-diphospho-sugar transferase [Scenedesmus sp. NREL 46B-D3]